MKINLYFASTALFLLIVSCSPRSVHIEEAIQKNTNPLRFELTHKRITGNLSAIAENENLEVLILNFNALNSLPREFGRLKNLKKLHLYGNNLKELPPEIGELKSLQELILGRNPITEVPSSLRNLQELKILALDDTRITLSEKDVEILASLTGLRILDLSDIPTITETPSNIELLKHIPRILLKNTKLTLKEREKIFLALPNTQLVK